MKCPYCFTLFNQEELEAFGWEHITWCRTQPRLKEPNIRYHYDVIETSDDIGLSNVLNKRSEAGFELYAMFPITTKTRTIPGVYEPNAEFIVIHRRPYRER